MTGTGKAKINIDKAVAGGKYCFIIEYETGAFGVDDSGEIIIARRDVCDSVIPQFDDSFVSGYVSVWTDSKAALKVQYRPDRYIRPWKSCISIKVSDGSLEEGDKVFIRYGMPDSEGIGYRIQTFKEKEHIFRLMVDCAGSGDFYDIEQQPIIEITGGIAYELQMVAPSIVKKGEAFDIFVRAMDSYGNIAQCYNDLVILYDGTEEKRSVHLSNGTGVFKSISVLKEGVHTFSCSAENGFIDGLSNPIKCVCNKNGKSLYWGDMHSQTKETVGTGNVDELFSFARDMAKMDFCGWQGNDFQVTDDIWAKVCRSTREYHDPGKFITFLGYEWSGTTPTGGDHNIYFLKDDQPIHRSYHWQIDMNKRDGTDRNPISKLFKEFKGRNDVIAIPHVGGRHGNIDYYDDNFIRQMEIHSHHGTFEWFVEEAISRGLKPGIIAASDDHTCRPGLSYPTRKSSRGFISFDVMGGYTGVYTDELTRECLWKAFKERHTYGTTGQRIMLDVKCDKYIMGDEFKIDKSPVINIEAAGTNEIMDVELKRGLKVIAKYSDSLQKNTNRIRIHWSGVRVRSRSKKVNWDGSVVIKNGLVKNLESFAFNKPDEMAYQMSGQEIRWISNTSGDFSGIEFDINWSEKTTITFTTRHKCFVIHVKDLLDEDLSYDAGGVNQKVILGFVTVGNQNNVSMTYSDDQIQKGINPYWVRVIQKDGHMAWSSPMYIQYL